MIDHPTAYFSRWVSARSNLLKNLESEAARKDIPIVGPVAGRLLYLMVRVSGARRIIELGTATGYSAILMGQACRQNQGRIITFELDPAMAEKARTNIAEAGLSTVIEVRCQDACEGLASIEDQADMVFMDIEKRDYIKMLPVIEKIMAPSGLLVADNTGFKDAHQFNKAMHENPCWDSVNLWSYLPGHSPEYDGICIAVKTHRGEDQDA